MASSSYRPHLRITALLAAFITQCSATPLPFETWVACTVDLAALDASSLQQEVLQGLSSFRCLSHATWLSWAFLACYDSSGTCTIWELQAVAVGSAVKNTSHSPGIICKIPDRSLGCFRADGSVVALDESTDSTVCPDTMLDTCTETGIVTTDKPNPTAVPPPTSCLTPFVQTTFACLYVNDVDYFTWCDARPYCQNLGGDLISPDTPEDFVALSDYLIQTFGVSEKYLLVGALYSGGQWQWLGSGRSPGPPGTQDWANGQPNAATPAAQPCTRVGTNMNYRLEDIGCGEGNMVICEVKL